jgi:hypothetical protein
MTESCEYCGSSDEVELCIDPFLEAKNPCEDMKPSLICSECYKKLKEQS